MNEVRLLLNLTKQCLNDKRPVCIMSCNPLMMSRVPAATLRACTLSTYGVEVENGGWGGGTVNSPGVCTFIYCWEMLIVATASLCVGTWAVPVLHHGLTTAAGNGEKKGRGRNSRECRGGKHFRKEWHGTQTRQSLKPADNPADWFGHIRHGNRASIWQSGACKRMMKCGLTALLGQRLPANFGN